MNKVFIPSKDHILHRDRIRGIYGSDDGAKEGDGILKLLFLFNNICSHQVHNGTRNRDIPIQIGRRLQRREQELGKVRAIDWKPSEDTRSLMI